MDWCEVECINAMATSQTMNRKTAAAVTRFEARYKMKQISNLSRDAETSLHLFKNE